MTDFCSLEAAPLLTLEQALDRMRRDIRPVAQTETIGLAEAYRRVLAEDAVSAINLPSGNNAAMDGYALASDDIINNQPFQLRIAGTSWAGKPYPGTLQRGECVRIFTGAVLPEGADTVVMQEKTSAKDTLISFPAEIKPGENVRLAGEDIKQGDITCCRGKKLGPVDIGFLAATGMASVSVYRRLNIAYFSTGDELVSIGQPLQTGQLYDSNRYMMRGMLADPAFNPLDLGVIPDDEVQLSQTISRAAENDVIISTGGASVGDADFVQGVLAKLGRIHIWKIAVKPGKPLIFGMIGSCYYFGLPGNPVSMAIIFQQIVLPMLSLISGAHEPKRRRITAVCTTALKKSPGRLEFQRGILSQNENGQLFVASAGKQGSHILSSMSRSNCYIILPAENKGVEAGETVIVEPFSL